MIALSVSAIDNIVPMVVMCKAQETVLEILKENIWIIVRIMIVVIMEPIANWITDCLSVLIHRNNCVILYKVFTVYHVSRYENSIAIESILKNIHLNSEIMSSFCQPKAHKL